MGLMATVTIEVQENVEVHALSMAEVDCEDSDGQETAYYVLSLDNGSELVITQRGISFKDDCHQSDNEWWPRHAGYACWDEIVDLLMQLRKPYIKDNALMGGRGEA